MRTRLIFASLLIATTAAACADNVEDELAGEDTTEISDDKADASTTYTYYTVAPDLRRCAFPACGGLWVARVNRSTTKCGDGSYQAQCYVADADWAKLGLDAPIQAKVVDAARGGKLVVRATVGKKTYAQGSFGYLKPTEAWFGQGRGQPDGVFVKLELSGVRCIAAPCPSFREHKLNGSGVVDIAEVGWDDTDASSAAVGHAIEDLTTYQAIIAGDRYTVHGAGGSGKARSATQFYIRAHD